MLLYLLSEGVLQEYNDLRLQTSNYAYPSHLEQTPYIQNAVRTHQSLFIYSSRVDVDDLLPVDLEFRILALSP